MMYQSRIATLLSGCLTVAVGIGSMLSVVPAQAATVLSSTVKLKDITHIKGVRNNQVVGYGLVMGLSKTGDQSRSTLNAEFNLIRNMGGRLNNENDIRSTNTAAVVVTAIIPPFAKEGDHIDVTVSSMADAKSLEGGVLVATQLVAPNGEIVAVAQGPLSTGGVDVSSGGSSVRTAITTSARIPNGAIIERDINTQIGDDYGVELVLNNRSDYTMAQRVASQISTVAPAIPIDGSTIRVTIPDKYLNNRVGFLAMIENLSVATVPPGARIVINERTGTVVIGQGVKLMPAAVAHGGITVTVKTENSASQPNALAQGQTTTLENASIDVEQRGGSIVELPGGTSLGDLVSALNAIGVKPNDLISILQALKAAGSLEATLEII